jgi:co-chaperonin GroES (HSP10)
MPKLKYTPEWSKYEKDLHSPDSQTAFKAGIAFDETRKNEINNSAKARRFEESRKEAWSKDKPQWVKERNREQQLQEQKIINELREGGYLMGGLKPASGLLLVVKTEQTETTQGGIFLPESVEYESNLAKVVRVGASVQGMMQVVDPPCKEGDTILFRKAAGLNVKINNIPHLLIRFDEVFGVVEE